jgi:predicted membrane channel-forming protein YqfA (hemolysin III family)
MNTTQMFAMFVIQAMATGLGGYCLVLLFKKARNQVIIAFHLLVGFGAIETLVGAIHMSDLAADSPVRALGMTALKCFGAAALAGILIPLVGKGRPQLVNLLLAIHVGSALVGSFTSLSFVGQICGLSPNRL